MLLLWNKAIGTMSKGNPACICRLFCNLYPGAGSELHWVCPGAFCTSLSWQWHLQHSQLCSGFSILGIAHHTVRTSSFTGNFGTKNQRWTPGRGESHLTNPRDPRLHPRTNQFFTSGTPAKLQLYFCSESDSSSSCSCKLQKCALTKTHPFWRVLRNYLIFLAPVGYFIGQELGDKCSVSLYGLFLKLPEKLLD